ncbi:aminotransferase class I/II-fold pyridoxal phosphate-dependent enzyme [Kinneretia aquatilis]|uniref:aminotransferase class I/II-fold pyridoxal phosphate-dependent enzyme n=1 Tax=Kinneretia aquatilis TaxID=2070761 RepID=UPI0014951A42|nr:aminotransferase class I/II-fold pyridoxal phosphate-dependent enzyme [Paucibacter aquatile]WIV97440.1 aminotransferase class I/II-fold pyridoxal phosphate-dependent enzyme [Paucibacter aquatile]
MQKKIEHLKVRREQNVREALQKLDAAGSGVLLLVDSQGKFERTITDGDLRRLMLSDAGLESTLSLLPSMKSVVVQPGAAAREEALTLMVRHSIHHVPVIDSSGEVLQVLDRKDLDEQILLSTPHLGDQEQEFVAEAFRTNWIAPLGPNVDGFERELAAWVGVKHAAAVSSGTAAIHLALRLLDVTAGDEVFCSALTFVATANPVIYQSAEPVFIDSEPESWNMSPQALERALADARRRGKLPKAVIVVNLYGQSADMDAIIQLCDAYGVPLIEDAAESLGATYKDRQSGSFGRIGIYSFNGNKIITTSGGGMLVADDEDLVRRARFLSTQAREPVPHYEHTTIGYNYRMSNILAGVGRGQLRVLADRVDARRRVFDRYRAGLADIDAIEWMPEPSWSRSNRWLTAGVIRPDRSNVTSADLMGRLAALRIEARPVWKPMQMQPVFKDKRYFAHDSNSVSQQLFETGFCLPSGSNMSDGQQDRVIDALRGLLRQA